MPISKYIPTAFVSTLPSSPIDGQEIYYQSSIDGSGGAATGATSETMASIGAIWHLRYRANSSSSYKWEFVGGPPVIVSTSATPGFGEATQATHTNYQSLTNVLTVVAPARGDYLVIVGAECQTPATSGASASASYKIGEQPNASDFDRVVVLTPTASATTASAQREQIKTISGATTVERTLTAQYKSSTSSAATFLSRWIGIQPVRIG